MKPETDGNELRVGVIGYGGRASGNAREVAGMDAAVRIAAVADPRRDEIRGRGDKLLAGTAFFRNADELLASGRFDGIIIGTRCNLHTEMALKVASTGTPLFLEKPVSVTFDQVKALAAAAPSFKAPVVVSFPLRLSPLVIRTKELIASGAIGKVEHMVAFNDVPYGEVYYASWYRDYPTVGGLFLQKATHDLDYMSFIVEAPAKWVCAMKSQRIYGRRADKPYDLKCKDCNEKKTCPESPFNENSMIPPDSREHWAERWCMFPAEIKNEDSGNCIVEYANGVQASYTQNFYARHRAARRGVRIHGYTGTIEFDWYTGKIAVMRHDKPDVEVIDFSGGEAHFGGDAELCKEFIAVMRGKPSSRSPLEAGIHSALTCLYARESAETRRFFEVRLPE